MVFKVTHKFDFKERKKLINEKRKKILPAEKTLLDLDLKKGDVFADIGSGKKIVFIFHKVSFYNCKSILANSIHLKCTFKNFVFIINFIYICMHYMKYLITP